MSFKPILIFLFLITLFSNHVYGQTFQMYLDSVNYYGDQLNEWDRAAYFGKLAIEQAIIEQDTHYVDQAQIALNIIYFAENKKNFRAAIDYSMKYYDILKKGHEGQECEYAHYIGSLGKYYKLIEKYDSALYYFDIAEKLYDYCDNNETVSYQTFAVAYASAAEMLMKYELAQQYFDKAYKLLDKVFNERNIDYLVTLNNYGNFKNKIDPHEARKYFDELMQYSSDIDNLALGTKEILYFNCGVFYGNNKIKTFKECYRKYLEILKSKGPLTFPDALDILIVSRAYYNYGDGSLGRYYMNLSDSIAKSTFKSDKNNVNYIAKFYLTKAKLYADTYDFENASKYYEQLAEVSGKIYSPTSPSLTKNYNYAAVYFHKQGDFSKAEKYYQKAIQIAKNIGKNGEYYLYRSYVGLGLLYAKTGILNEGGKYLHDAVEYYKGKPMYIEGLAVASNNLGLYFKLNKKYAIAEKYYLESLDLQKELIKRNIPSYLDNVYNNLGSIAHAQGDYEKARKYYNKAIEYILESNTSAITQLSYASYLSNLAGTYRKEKNYGKAEKILKKAIAILEKYYSHYHSKLGIRYFNLALVYSAQNKIKPAEKYYSKAEEIYRYQLNNIFRTLNEKQKLEHIQKFNEFISDYISFSINKAPLTSDRKKTIANTIISLKSKIFNSNKQIKNYISQSGNDELKELYNNWNIKKNLLAHNYALSKEELKNQNINLDSLISEINSLEKEISLECNIPETQGQIGWKTIKNILKNNEAYVEIFCFQDIYSQKRMITNYMALIIKPDTDYPEIVTFDSITNYEYLFYKTDQNAAFITENIDFSAHDSLNSLNLYYDILWRPIKEATKGASVIYISLDGVFNKINFNAFYNSKAKKYLIEEKDIRLLSSAAALKNVRNNANPLNKKVCFFGDPDFALSDADSVLLSETNGDETRNLLSTPLPNTRVEIQEASALFSEKGWDVSCYLGKVAREDSLRSMIQPGILHIATHGKFLTDRDAEYLQESGATSKFFIDDPLFRSYLTFAGANSYKNTQESGDDGYLTAYEAMNLDLSGVELLTLSACETALGAIHNGEGVFGLRRAFFYAGAKKIVMSLWKVYDEPTRKFMVKFYENYLSGMTFREAFRQAQLFIKDKYPNPFIWGSFVMVEG